MSGKFRFGVVEWRDATLYTEKGHKPQLIQCKTAGWISVGKDKVIVIFSFTEEEPDVYIVIPKTWATKIIFLEVGDENPQLKNLQR